MVFISKYGKFCILEKKNGELDENLYTRGWFIVSQLSKKSSDYNELVRLSKLWQNVKHYKCGYDKELMNMISKLENNMYSVSSNFKH